MTTADIQRGIGEVINAIISQGTRSGQYMGVVDGVKRTIGLKNGRIGQYY